MILIPISQDYYLQNPQFRDYFLSLPADIRQALCMSGTPISTLGELKMVAEHLQKNT
ncbi:hypothetical protein LJB77_02150 [Ruminococcaceae bacterium OttesenSCG-928-N02]|nr:hypothetical protein [Ruminococcaceae bacterium OttesenSCG-928-N02]